MDVSDYTTTSRGDRVAVPHTSHSTSRLGDVAVKTTLKYLATCKDPAAYCAVVRAAPDGVIKSIANAAYNAQRGDIYLTPSDKALFGSHRNTIAKLTSPGVGIGQKRELIASQEGGFPFLPLLIGSALAALGSRLFGGSTTPAQ